MTIGRLFYFKNNNFYVRRLLTVYTKIQSLISFIIRNNPLQLLYLNYEKKCYLNCGCGCNVYHNFINLDYNWSPGVDLCWDLRRKIPLPDHSLRGIYAEHLIEHLPLQVCKKVIKEFKRLMKIGAVLRIVVPDMELYLELYNKHKAGMKPEFPYSTRDDDCTPMMRLNEVFYGFGHQYNYDAETLARSSKRRDLLKLKRFRSGKGEKKIC